MFSRQQRSSKKELVVEIGLFDRNAVRIEDFDLWFRLCKSGIKIGYQRDVLLKYRIRPGSLTGNSIQRSERSIAALRLVKEKHEFSDSELEAWNSQIKACEKQLNLEKGKHNLVKGNFADARRDFALANFDNRFKLTGLNLMLAISPKLVLTIFKKFRPAEFSYLNSSQSSKTR